MQPPVPQSISTDVRKRRAQVAAGGSLKHIIQWYRQSPLLKKMTLLAVMVLLIPCLLLSVILFRAEVNRQIEEEIATNETVLEAIASDISNQLAYVESVIALMAESPVLRSLLSSPPDMIGDMAIMLIYDVSEVLEDYTAYLRDAEGAVMLIALDEHIPEVYGKLMHHESMLADESYASFIEGDTYAAWGTVGYFMPPGMMNASFYTSQKIPYYKSINAAFLERLGTIKCSVSLAQVLRPLHTWIDASALMAFQQDTCVWFSGDDGFAVPGRIRDTSWREGSTLYISVPLGKADMTLVLAASFTGLQRQALLSVVPFAFLVVQALIVIILITRALLRSILSRLRLTVDAMTHIGDDTALVQLPEGDPDEIGMLVSAFNALLARIGSQHEEILQKEVSKQRAQVLALQHQMNPHFLFNSLHWLQLQAETGASGDELSNAIALLGDVLHYNLSAHPYATVGMELAHMEGYIAFIRLWKRTEIRLTIGCDPQALACVVPRFTLQPLVENAVWHGLVPGEDLHIDIAIARLEDRLEIQVHNDGRPVTAEQLADMRRRVSREETQRTEQGVGLSNLARRLHLLYGEAAAVQIEADAGEPRITLCLPAHVEEAVQAWIS